MEQVQKPGSFYCNVRASEAIQTESPSQCEFISRYFKVFSILLLS